MIPTECQWSEIASVRVSKLAMTTRKGYRTVWPHRQPQLEVRSRATGIPRFATGGYSPAGLANREAILPSGEPITRSFVENRSELRYNTSQNKRLSLVESFLFYYLGGFG